MSAPQTAPASSRDDTGDTSAPARPLRRDAERNRERIVAAAREVFATQGLSAGFNEIAHHAGVGVGTVYRRFPDKDALIEAALEERVLVMVQAVRDALAHDRAWDGLVFSFQALAAINACDRGARDLAFSVGHASDDGAGSERHRLMREQLTPLMQELVDRAHAEGSLRADATIADVVLAHFTISEYAHGSAGVRPQAYRRLMTLLLDGLRTREDSPAGTPFDEGPLVMDEADAIIDAWMHARSL